VNRVFLSYSHEDASELSELLYTRLTGAGYEVWKDNHQLGPGTHWVGALSDAVSGYDHFIVLLTPAALASDWVKDEIEMAIISRRHIIPIRSGEVTIPPYHKKIQHMEMKDLNDWRAIHKLVNHMGEGRTIPRVYNMSGHSKIECCGILILGHSPFELADLTDPTTIADIAKSMAESALPYIAEAGAGIVPHGHPALACSVLAHLLGLYNDMPKLYYTHRFANDKFGINADKCVRLQDMRIQAFEHRSKHL